MAHPIKTCGMAAADKQGVFKPMNFEHRPLKDTLIHIEITHAGVCHSDIHLCRSEWTGDATPYPMVPGHEIVGVVKGVGPDVKKYKVGDHVAVGCMVDSCGDCANCKRHLQQYCQKKNVSTYADVHTYDDGSATRGGYARDIVVRESFVLQVPKQLQGKLGVAPLLCAGITTYSPMKHWKMDRPGTKIGVMGLGGLGHMAVKFGAAFGNEVTVFSRSNKKEALAKKMGAKNVIISNDPEAMKAAKGTLDFIVDTISVSKDLSGYLDCLTTDGVMVAVGIPSVSDPLAFHPLPLVLGRKSLAGSLIGGIQETQEMLDFCAQKNIVCEVEEIGMDDIKKVHDRVVDSDVQFRFVFDIKKSCPKLEDTEKLPAKKKIVFTK
eukprot:Selendium_serpulae@DN6228_c0_g2_i3.p1